MRVRAKKQLVKRLSPDDRRCEPPQWGVANQQYDNKPFILLLEMTSS